MLQFSEGCHQAFTTLYQRHKGPLLRYCVRQLGQPHAAQAEEIFQDVWFRVVDKREHYQVSAKFTTWLYTLAHHLLIDAYRKAQSEQSYQQSQCDHTPSLPTEVPLAEREKQAIQHCVAALPAQQREAFLLKHEGGLSQQQICDIIEAKAETLKTRLRYAMNQLRQCLTLKLGDRQ
uniref:sigma-70 family RNA polymerase sigma factor n=1 Tax=Thaumasiovibrio occultus TaxID=1891184 RepID=UPI000B34BA85|nr:sigma-70 family RNA polymerase sigma factor [Thaumasiovibrio occultus]